MTTSSNSKIKMSIPMICVFVYVRMYSILCSQCIVIMIIDSVAFYTILYAMCYVTCAKVPIKEIYSSFEIYDLLVNFRNRPLNSPPFFFFSSGSVFVSASVDDIDDDDVGFLNPLVIAI